MESQNPTWIEMEVLLAWVCAVNGGCLAVHDRAGTYEHIPATTWHERFPRTKQ